MMIPLTLNSNLKIFREKWRIERRNGERCTLRNLFTLSTHFPRSPDKDFYLFLALQLFVRISVHLSSPGIKSSPQESGEVPLDEK
jgi:hypothetical protein